MTPVPKKAARNRILKFLPLAGLLVVIPLSVSSFRSQGAAASAEKRVAALPQVLVRASPSEALPDLVEAACPAVVSLRGAERQKDQREPANYSGIVVSPDGYIVTVADAVADRSTVPVHFADGGMGEGAVIAVDEFTHIALVKVDTRDRPALRFADADIPRIGTWGFDLSPHGGRGCEVAPGTVTSDFAVRPTNQGISITAGPHSVETPPGTPFIGADGLVLGMAVDTKADGAGNGRTLVPGFLAMRYFRSMVRTGGPISAPYGIASESLTPRLAQRLGAPRQRDAVVVKVKPGSAAANAGVRTGDIIVSVMGVPTSSVTELERALASDANAVELVVMRQGAPVMLKLSRADRSGDGATTKKSP